MESLSSYVRNDITPLWQTILAWVYLTANVILLSLGTFSKRKSSDFILGGLGVTYIIYALVAAFVVIKNRLAVFDIRFQGTTNLMLGLNERTLIHTGLQPGFYLALGTGILIIVIAFTRFLLDKNETKVN